MPKNTSEQAIRSRIDSFLAEIAALVKDQALQSVQEALGEGAAPRRRGPGRPRKMTIRVGRRPRTIAKRGLRGKRSSEQVAAMAARVLAEVRSKQGRRLEEIGKAMRTDTAVLKLPIAKLLAAKRLKTKGRKRGTRYFVR